MLYCGQISQLPTHVHKIQFYKYAEAYEMKMRNMNGKDIVVTLLNCKGSRIES